jgi:hypothetical protein
MMTPDSDKIQSDPSDAQPVRAPWEVPETIEIDLGQVESGFTFSNFDGHGGSS